ncbi:MATE family efflux transporter [Sphingomonas sp. LHG3406-1]|uniref:MATE family efflux transporter n=1 Tax=Sphingomonas sp. LHG3406-1 TaxID=2804617 RepID=UPI0026343DA6|nr:MATE family efflux transporter [Sphingomonas sp. LHG3406-1]
MADQDAPAAGARPHQRDLTTGPIGKTLLAFAIPTLGSSIVQSLNASINSIWVGRLLGEEALAATANANMVWFVLIAFTFGFSMATSILIGQAWGRRDVEGARRVLGTAVTFFFGVGILVLIAGELAAPDLLRLLGTPGEALPLAATYLRTFLLGTPAAVVLVALSMALRGSGDSVTPLYFMLLAAALDVVLNPLLIAGIGPFPALGIAGAGYATAIANWVALTGLILFAYARRLPLTLGGRDLRFLVPDRGQLGTIMGKGLPMGLQMIVISVSSLAMIGLVNAQGVETAAAYGVTMQLWAYVQMPAMAFGAAVSAMAAQNIGAGRWDRVDRITRIAIIQVTVITAALIGLFILFEKPALGLFLGMDSPALPIAIRIQWIATWSFLMFGLVLVLFGTVRAAGAVVAPLLILAVGLIPVRLGFAGGAQGWLGSDAIWWSFPVGTIVNLVLAWLYYRSGRWRKAKMAPTT